MPQRLKIIDRDTPMLLPPSIQEWVEADHPARLIVEMINHLDLSCASVNHKGTGDTQYPPGMMLALLIYCYSSGVFSSRKIERATYDSVGVRFICANEHPDHDTINKFRNENGELIHSAFAQVLRMAASLGLVSLNQLEIASDGTIFVAGASEKEYKSREEIDQEIEQINKADKLLHRQIDELLEKAKETDRQQTDQNKLPDPLKDPKARQQAIEQAVEEQKRLARRKARLDAAREFQKLATEENARQRDELRQAVTESEVGTIPKHLPGEVQPEDKINVHEPESTKMKLKKGGYGHGYNAQASVDTGGIGLAVGGHVTDAPNDRQQLESCINAVEENLGAGCVGASLADRGYDNTFQIDRLEQKGVEVLCELQQTQAEKNGEFLGQSRGRRKRTYEFRQEHFRKISTGENKQKRKRRKETVEPLFGTIKHAMGFQEFRAKGLDGASVEWQLVLLCCNTAKLNKNSKWRKFIGLN